MRQLIDQKDLRQKLVKDVLFGPDVVSGLAPIDVYCYHVSEATPYVLLPFKHIFNDNGTLEIQDNINKNFTIHMSLCKEEHHLIFDMRYHSRDGFVKVTQHSSFAPLQFNPAYSDEYVLVLTFHGPNFPIPVIMEYNAKDISSHKDDDIAQYLLEDFLYKGELNYINPLKSLAEDDKIRYVVETSKALQQEDKEVLIDPTNVAEFVSMPDIVGSFLSDNREIFWSFNPETNLISYQDGDTVYIYWFTPEDDGSLDESMIRHIFDVVEVNEWFCKYYVDINDLTNYKVDKDYSGFCSTGKEFKLDVRIDQDDRISKIEYSLTDGSAGFEFSIADESTDIIHVANLKDTVTDDTIATYIKESYFQNGSYRDNTLSFNYLGKINKNLPNQIVDVTSFVYTVDDQLYFRGPFNNICMYHWDK